MYYDVETKVYQNDKGIFIKRAGGDKTPKYLYDGEMAVCKIAIAKEWEIFVRCDLEDNCFPVQLRDHGRIRHELHPTTLDELNGYAIPFCFHVYYNQRSLDARKMYSGSFGVADAAGDGMLLFLSCLILMAVASYFGGILGAIIGILLAVAVANIVGDSVRSEAEVAGYYKGMAASIARRFNLNNETELEKGLGKAASPEDETPAKTSE